VKPDPKQFNEWLALRSRLYAQERAFERARAAQRGVEDSGREQELSIQYSEIRALRALSRAIIRRSFLDESGADEKPQRGRK
jgi:hypothetical protein